MPTDLEAEGGGDPTKAITAMLDDQMEPLTRDAAHLWFQESSDFLTEAAEQRSELGRQHGRTGRAQQGLHAIENSAYPPEWTGGEWVFGYSHVGAVFQEFGAMPHEIKAKRAEFLAFEWPDAPEPIKKEFAHTEGDLVFFKSIDHPGIPAIGWVRYGRDKAATLLKDRGYGVTFYTESGS